MAYNDMFSSGFQKVGLHSAQVGLIKKSFFLWTLVLQGCCDFVGRNLLIFGYLSLDGNLEFFGGQI